MRVAAVRPQCACVLLLLLGAALLLAGCTHNKQINQITFVTALGIDKTDDGVEVHAAVAIPSRFAALSPSGGTSSAGENPIYIISEKGRNISEAIFKMKRKSARDVKFGHTKVVLLSDELAKSGISQHMDLLMRREELQIISWIGITEGSTKTILAVQPEVPETMSDYLVDVFSRVGSTSYEIYPTYSYELYSYLHEPGSSAYSMLMKPKKSGNHVEFTGCMIFRDDKAVGVLTPTQTKYLQMLRGVSVAPASFTLPQSGTTLALLSSHVKLIATDTEIGADLRLNLELDETRHPEVSDEELQRMQQELNQYVEQDMKQMLAQLQRLHSDPVGFGEKYRVSRSGSLDAAKWLSQDYPQRAVTIRVNSFIKRTGMIR